MNQQGTLEIIVREFTEVIEPLRLAVYDLDNFKSFMRNVGWDVEDLPPDYANLVNDIDHLISSVNALGDSPDIKDILNILDSIKGLFTTIKSLSNAPAGVVGSDFLSEFSERLFEFLFIDYLRRSLPNVYYALEILGIIRQQEHLETPTRPAYIRVALDTNKVSTVLKDPTEFLDSVFNWGTSDFGYNNLIEILFELFVSLGFSPRLNWNDPSISTNYSTPSQYLSGHGVLEVPFFDFILDDSSYPVGIKIAFFGGDNDNPAQGILIDSLFPSEIPLQIEINSNWILILKARTNLIAQFGVIITPWDVNVRLPFQNSAQLPDFGFGATLKYIPESPLILLGSPNASRLEFGEAAVSFNLNYLDLNTLELAAGLDFEDFKIVLKGSEGDGFLNKILGDKEQIIESDLGLSWSNISGFKFKGGGLALEIALNKHIQLGPLAIEELIIAIKSLSGNTAGVEISAGANLSLQLGPFFAIAEGLGVSLKTKFEEGNVGPFDMRVGFKPPKGLGLFLETAAVKGGGYLFFDHDNHKYAGVAELSIKDKIALKAIGLISTRMQDGSKGFSMLLIITAEFTPINIGFGFTLNGVGGLVGIHRTMLLDVLRTGVKTGAIANILFPVDPVKNAPALIASIGSVFPVAQGRFAFGIMGKFGWGTPTLITIDLGLIIEVPNPVRFAILGVLRVALPSEDTKTIRINVNFLGTIEFEKKQIAFDASIFDSQLGEVTLTGDMALRIGWGNNKNFLLSVGGFHPSFQAPPALLYLSRITVNFLSQKKLSLVLTTYMAVTSNTAQFGAKIALDGEVTSKLTFKGHVSLDALFQFKPFHMDVLFEAYLALLWKGKEKMSISVSASLTGPSNWVMNGEAEAKILGIKFKVAVAAEWGRKEVDSLPGIDVAPLLLAALGDIRNWEANLPANKPPLVKLRKYTSLNPVVHPHGLLKISQKQVPLNVVVQKFGSQPANDAGTFVINTVTIGSSSSNSIVYAKEDFAPAQFREMSDTAKLSSPSFTQFDSGAVVGDSILKGVHLVTREIAYEVSILGGTAPNTSHAERPEVLEAAARASAAARTPLASVRVTKSALAPLEMTVLEEKYGVVDSFDLRMHTGTVLYPTMVQALDKYAALVGINPLIKNELRVIPEFEITP